MSYSIQRSTLAVVIAFATNSTLGVSTALALNGLLRGVQVNAPDLDSTNIYTVTVKDASLGASRSPHLLETAPARLNLEG